MRFVGIIVFVAAAFVVAGGAAWAAPGELDTSFQDDGVLLIDFYDETQDADDYGTDLAVRSDGTVISVGYTGTGSSRKGLVAAQVAGINEDIFFGEGGFVEVDIPGDNDAFTCVTFGSSRKILAAGNAGGLGESNVYIYRFNSDGSPDTSFGTDGYMSIVSKKSELYVNDMKMASDGALYVAGGITEGLATDYWIRKYNKDGTLDEDWGTSGGKTISVPGFYAAKSLAFGSSGEVYLAGTAKNADKDMAVVALDENGELIPGFGDSGIVYVDITGEEEGEAVVVQSDGEIIVGGWNSAGKYCVARLWSSDGTIAAARNLSPGAGAELSDLLLRDDDSLVLVGKTDAGTSVYEVPADVAGGVSDVDDALSFESFGTGKGALDSEGNIYFAGYSKKNADSNVNLTVFYYNDELSLGDARSNERTAVSSESAVGANPYQGGDFILACDISNYGMRMRLDEDGDPNRSFSIDGKQSVDMVEQVVSLADSEVIGNYSYIVGTVDNSGDRDFAVWALDISSGGSLGYSDEFDFGSNNDYAYGAAPTPDGKLMVVGRSENKMVLMRVLVNTAADPGFSDDGVVTGDFGDYQLGNAVAVQPNGKAVVGGRITQSGVSSFFFARYTDTGELDDTFGTGGWVSHTHGGSDSCNNIVLQSDGKIIACGSSAGASVLVMRLMPDGSLDTSFGNLGKAVFSELSNAEKILVDPYDGILIAGSDGDTAAILRLNSDGSVDTSFGTAGKALYAPMESAKFEDMFFNDEFDLIAVGEQSRSLANSDALIAKFQGPQGVDNDPPTVVDDAATTDKNTAVVIDVLSNDSDPDGDTLSILSVTEPAHGTAVISGTNVDYTPELDYVGTDTFDYTATDGNGNIGTGTVTVTVNDSGGVATYDVTGWWYTPGEGGTGLSVGMSADQSVIFLAWYVYDNTGDAIWYVAWCASTGVNTYTGDVRRYVGAPLGTFTDEGDVTLSFTTENTGTISWDMSMLRANPGSKAIERYMPTLDAGASDPVGFNGWWADSFNHPATGIFVEAAGDTLYLGRYYYRDDNTPVWEVMGGFMDPDGFNPASGVYTATVKEISGGQTVGGDYQAPVIPDTGRAGTLTFAADGSSMTFSCGGDVYNLSPYTISMP